MIVMQEIKQILFVTLLFTSCINEDDSLINNQVEINSSNNFYKVSLAEADKYANDILEDLAGTTSTRSVKRKLVNVEYKVFSHKTRRSFSDLPDTVLYLLNSQYGIKETVTKLNAQKRTFEALGYNCDEYTTYFDPYYAIQWLSGTLESNINQRGPVLMSGLSPGKSTGHNWVIDGYLLNDIYTRRAGSTDESAWVKYAHDFELFHCVWGWGGKSNGYYCFSSKYAFSGKPIFTGVPDDNDRDIVYVFDKNIKCMVGFKIRK